MTTTRRMTIARGLTRLKTIKAQLDNIRNEIARYGAWSNREKHPYGDSNSLTSNQELKKNHQQAQEKIESLYQQFHDLLDEYSKLKSAIDYTNNVTTLVIGEKAMTLKEAMVYQRDLSDLVSNLVSANDMAVRQAERKVESYNANLTKAQIAEEVKEIGMASVLYLVNQKRVKELNDFQVLFLTEIDGTLNEVNALTEIIFPNPNLLIKAEQLV